MMKNALYYVLVILAMVMVVYFIFGNNGQRRQISSTQNSQNNYKQAKSKSLKCSLQMVYVKITGEYKEQQTVANSGGLAILGSTDTTTTHFHNNHFAK